MPNVSKIQLQLENDLHHWDRTEQGPTQEESESFIDLCREWLQAEPKSFIAWWLQFRDPQPTADETRVQQFLVRFGPDATFADMKTFLADGAAKQATE